MTHHLTKVRYILWYFKPIRFGRILSFQTRLNRTYMSRNYLLDNDKQQLNKDQQAESEIKEKQKLVQK